jgi:hypothetical protein
MQLISVRSLIREAFGAVIPVEKQAKKKAERSALPSLNSP